MPPHYPGIRSPSHIALHVYQKILHPPIDKTHAIAGIGAPCEKWVKDSLHTDTSLALPTPRGTPVSARAAITNELPQKRTRPWAGAVARAQWHQPVYVYLDAASCPAGASGSRPCGCKKPPSRASTGWHDERGKMKNTLDLGNGSVQGGQEGIGI